MSAFQQLGAVLLRKFLTTKRDKKFLVIGLVFPIIATIAVVIIQHLTKPPVQQTYQQVIDYNGGNTIIPYISDTPFFNFTNLAQYFPETFEFRQFDNSTQLNDALLNDPTYSNTIGGYYVNVGEEYHFYNVSVWYNDPDSLPFLSKALYQAILRYETNEEVDLEETNVLLPSGINPFQIFMFYAPVLLEYGFVFMMPYFAVQLVIDREKQLKQALLLNGLRAKYYWIGTILADYALYLVAAMISLIIMCSAKVYTGVAAVHALIIFLLLGQAGIALGYLMSFMFDHEETANRWLYATHSIITAVPVTISSVLQAHISSPYLDLLAIFPAFGLYRGLTMVAIDGTLWRIYLVMIFDIVLFWGIIFAIENKLFSRKKKVDTSNVKTYVEDDDVIAERQKTLAPNDAEISAAEIVKSYDGKSLAVKGVSFSIQDGECFGLLGPNGAGKTSLLSIMCGLMDADLGSIKRKSREHYVQGFCPQFDTLWDLMTGVEHLKVFSMVKGLDSKQTAAAIEESIQLFGIAEHAEKLSVTYSGGTKRKLCAAIALLADPAVVFMDEPSTGMDPLSRRKMWNVIQQKKEGRAVILTTHSMEEAEALSTRVAIMVKGQLRCIGTSQHLRNKYGSGYRITISCSPDKMDEVESFIGREFQPTSREKGLVGLLNFDVPRKGFSLQRSFTVIEANKAHLGITDYCVSQTSLEQVFLRFALEQANEEAHDAEEQQTKK